MTEETELEEPITPAQLTRADAKQMTVEQIVEAKAAGLFDDLLAGKPTDPKD